MKRLHLIEIGDEPWCPRGIRLGVTDFCRFVTEMSHVFNPVAPLLATALRKTGARRIVDMGSGAAGPWLSLRSVLARSGVEVPIVLTDRYPNLEAMQRAEQVSDGAIAFRSEPVDATQVSTELAGFRTMFSAFHHLRPEQARAVLADAVAKGQGIGIFECADRNILLLPLLLVTPLRVLIAMPFIRPFRWSRLFWTYLVPALPLVLLFDVIVSCLRIYSVPELRELTVGLDSYQWEAGTVRGGLIPLPLTYLIGVPASAQRVENPEPCAPSSA
jgi:hypothetical protein